jgi:hypothetical protein
VGSWSWFCAGWERVLLGNCMLSVAVVGVVRVGSCQLVLVVCWMGEGTVG